MDVKELAWHQTVETLAQTQADATYVAQSRPSSQQICRPLRSHTVQNAILHYNRQLV